MKPAEQGSIPAWLRDLLFARGGARRDVGPLGVAAARADDL
jgi:hypothetical protein